MKRIFVISLIINIITLFVVSTYRISAKELDEESGRYAQHKYDDSIRCYAMINYILANDSLIKSYIEKREPLIPYVNKKLYINPNEKGKMFYTPKKMEEELHEYYKDLQGDELYLAVREDFVRYTLEEIPFDVELLKEMNNYLDFIVRKGKKLNTSKSYWEILISDSFFNYKSVTITPIIKNTRYNYTNLLENLEIVFLFDNLNNIKTVSIQLWIP